MYPILSPVAPPSRRVTQRPGKKAVLGRHVGQGTPGIAHARSRVRRPSATAPLPCAPQLKPLRRPT